jgi:hypothetical protein
VLPGDLFFFDTRVSTFRCPAPGLSPATISGCSAATLLFTHPELEMPAEAALFMKVSLRGIARFVEDNQIADSNGLSAARHLVCASAGNFVQAMADAFRNRGRLPCVRLSHTTRLQATANSRSFRSLTFPLRIPASATDQLQPAIRFRSCCSPS